MRGLISSALNSFHNLGLDIREALDSHVSFNLGGSDLNGLYLRLPFTRLSAWIEWREASVGLGHERDGANWEFFAGRLQGVFCIEPAAAR